MFVSVFCWLYLFVYCKEICNYGNNINNGLVVSWISDINRS